EKFTERCFQMELDICKRKGVHFLQPRIGVLISGRGGLLHLFRFFILFHLVCQHPVVDKAATSECFMKKDLLFWCWINPEPVRPVHVFHPDYQYRNTSIGAPPVARRQKLLSSITFPAIRLN